jgi:very-short-patch-repair endonuclease
MAGIDKSGVARRVDVGRLHPVHRGVYAVGHVGLSVEGIWMAALLACGEGAALSHRSAACLWGLLTWTGGRVDVSVPTHGGRAKRVGIRVHRRRSMDPRTVVQRRRIPVTSPAQVLVDLQGQVSPRELRRATRQAEISRYRLPSGTATDGTRSDLERDFLRLCRSHGLPTPEVNVKIGRWTVDFLWRQERIAVETDFYDYHRGRVAFQDDHARDLDLRRRGFDVHRFSESQVNDQPAEIAADLRDALALCS